jgi:hypothetical protein
MSTASANSFNGPRQPISTLSLRLANSRTSVDSSSPASPWFRNEDATWWDDCLANGYICVGWDDVGDLGQYETVDGLRAALETTYYEANKGVAAQKAQLWTLTSCRPETSSLQTNAYARGGHSGARAVPAGPRPGRSADARGRARAQRRAVVPLRSSPLSFVAFRSTAFDDVLLAPEIAVLEPDHPRRRFVAMLCVYSAELDSGRLGALPYGDIDAERCARGELMPEKLFCPLAQWPDHRLAEASVVPFEQVELRRYGARHARGRAVT